MIQRIQSLYLLVVTALMAVTLFAPLAWFAADGEEFRLYAFSLQPLQRESLQPTVYSGLLLLASCLLPLVIILLYRRRLLQLSLWVVRLVRLFGAVALGVIYYFLSVRAFSDQTLHAQGFKPSIALPIVCLFFMYLAVRAIFRDELMVRAADRIR